MNTPRRYALGFCALCLAGFSLAAQPQTLETLHQFTNDLNDNSDGAFPKSGLVADSKGNLYGTTYEGGAYGYGTVFKLTKPQSGEAAWIHTVLKSFCEEESCIDGSYPTAGLAIDSGGNLYGTTSEGGFGGQGMVFKLVPPKNGETAWTEEVVHNFCAVQGQGCTDGSYPNADLLWSQSALYGTTYEGGTGCGLVGCGVVFKLTYSASKSPPWTYTVLHRFAGDDGAYPKARLIAEPQGALYGTTYEGGQYGYGTVFKLAPPANGKGAWAETVLYSFCSQSGCDDGSYPAAGLVRDAKGALYGTTYEGGTASACGVSGCGTVFKLTPPAKGETAWTQTVLHSFTGDADGAFPTSALIADAQGALYGTASEGGDDDFGTVFKLTPPAKGETAWTPSVLYTFTGLADGAFPAAGLIADAKGALYGTTYEGGYQGGSGACNFSGGCGTVFKLALPGLGNGPGKGHAASAGTPAP